MRAFETLNPQHQQDLIKQAAKRGDRWAKRHGLESLTGRACEPINQGRNKPCPCGSGKKYKRCCLSLVLAEAERRRRAMVAVRNGRTLERGGDDEGSECGDDDGRDCEVVAGGPSDGERLV